MRSIYKAGIGPFCAWAWDVALVTSRCPVVSCNVMMAHDTNVVRHHGIVYIKSRDTDVASHCDVAWLDVASRGEGRVTQFFTASHVTLGAT